MIAPLATDQANPLDPAAHAVVGQRDLKRGVDRFRAGIGIEYPAQPLRGDGGETAGQFERLRVAHVERRGVVEFGDLGLYRLDDARPPVTGVDAP